MSMIHSWPLSSLKSLGDRVLRPHFWLTGILKGSVFGPVIVLITEFFVVLIVMKFFFDGRRLVSVLSRDAGKRTNKG